MAYKIYTDALIVAQIFEEEISLDWLAKHAQAGLGNSVDATGATMKTFSFAYYVQKYWLQGQAMNIGSEESTSYKKRGWHHYERFQPYSPKPRRWDTRFKNIGFYSKYTDRQTGKTRGVSMNYLLKNLRRTGQERFLTKAWSKWGGPKNTREELSWMFEHGLNKMFEEAEARQKEEIRRQEANARADALHLAGRRYGT